MGEVTSGTGYAVSPRADTTYTLTVANASGASATAQLTVGVDTAPVTISAFGASPNLVDFGESSKLSWTLSGRAASLILDGVSVLGENHRTVFPVRRQTFVLAGFNPLGGQMRSLTVAARGLDLLAGHLGSAGTLDGTGSTARFKNPSGVALDGAGNVYVADAFNDTIRKVTAAGVVSTLAGLAGRDGSADGAGSDARFNGPRGVAVDGSGNVYVADTFNHTIRKVTSAGVVTTLAGMAGIAGSADGAGSTARFAQPSGVAVDNSGNVYVADKNNHTIRKISAAGMVTTLAGMAGQHGSTEGPGSAARFNGPRGVAVDASGNIYVADTDNSTIRKITPAGMVSTLAGSAGHDGSIDGAGSAARFNGPRGVAVDSSGDVYVGDTENHLIRKITPAGMVSTLAGMAGQFGSADGDGSAARFRFLEGVAVDGSGELQIGDTDNNTVRSVTSAGAVSTLAGSADTTGSADGTGNAARFNFPFGAAVDSAGNSYVADTGNNTLRKITSAGAVSTLAGLALTPGSVDGAGSTARFSGLRGVAVDGSGNLYVADTYNYTIRKVTAAGMVTTLAGMAGMFGSTDGTGSAARFNSPYGVATDGSGNLYVADTFNYTIRKVTPSGMVTTIAGSAGMAGSTDGAAGVARFNSPHGVAVDSSGNVYVADTYNHTIRKISSSGMVTTIAGSAGMVGSTDGPVGAARFNSPYGVAVDSSGNVYVADTYNYAIRKLSAAGMVTTMVGSASSIGGVPGPLPATLSSPRGIAFTPAGDLVVTCANGVVQITAF